jgi:hypothetical protein
MTDPYDPWARFPDAPPLPAKADSSFTQAMAAMREALGLGGGSSEGDGGDLTAQQLDACRVRVPSRHAARLCRDRESWKIQKRVATSAGVQTSPQLTMRGVWKL